MIVVVITTASQHNEALHEAVAKFVRLRKYAKYITLAEAWKGGLSGV